MLNVFFNDHNGGGVFRGSLDLRSRDALIRWQGIYPKGSRGTTIARVMERFTAQAFELLSLVDADVDKVTIDMTGLEYEWGNGLMAPLLNCHHDERSVEVLFAPAQQQALRVFMAELPLRFTARKNE